MPLTTLDPFIRQHYEVHEWRHATAILAADFPNELADIQAVLMEFRLRKSHILAPGGGKSEISKWIDSELAIILRPASISMAFCSFCRLSL